MSSDNKHPVLHFPGVLGFIGPLIALSSIGCAILLSPWFTWEGNALSDLGFYGNGIPAAIAFNIGLSLTGGVLLYFTYWFLKRISDVFTKIGMIPFLVAMAFLIFIGIFSEDFGSIHYWVSVGFFASFPFAMWITGFGFLRFSELRWFSVISVLLPFVSLYMWVGWYGGLFPFWPGNAIPEITTALTGIGWLWAVWFLYYKMKLDSIIPEE